MEKVVRGKRAGENQEEYLINYLEENLDIAHDKFVTADGAKFREEKWKEIAANLNAFGGTQKDDARWRKYWSDIRLHTRTKYSAIRQAEQRSSINGLSRPKALSLLEERIIKITTVEAVYGDETPEVGFEPNIIFEPIESLLALNIEAIGDPQAILSDSERNCNAEATTPPEAATTISGANTTAAASRSRARKRRAQPEKPEMDKFFLLEEKKIKRNGNIQ